MNEHECCIQNLSILFFFFEHLVFSLFFLSACEDLIRADRDSWCSRMRIRWGGIRCQTTIIFFYLHSLLPYLSLCAYLGSGCSRISSALPWPLPLPSTLPTQVAFLPAASHQACTSGRERERERGLDEEGGQRLQKANIQEEKVYKSVWGKLLIWVIGWMHIEATIVTIVPSLCKLLKTLSLTHILLYQLMTLQSQKTQNKAAGIVSRCGCDTPVTELHSALWFLLWMAQLTKAFWACYDIHLKKKTRSYLLPTPFWER